MSKVQLKKSSVPAKVPLVGDLDYGEPAINYADGALYFKTDTNEIQNLVAYNTKMSDGVMSTAVGGAAATDAAVWKTKTIIQALDTILFPDVFPTYTIPTITLSANQSGTKEIGQTISQVMTATGTENDAGSVTLIEIKRGSTSIASTSSPTGTITTAIASQFGYADPNNPNYYYTQGYTDSFVVVSGTTSWTGSINYNAGLKKLNNKGVTDSRAFSVRSTAAAQSAATGFASAAASVTGIYPWFWGKSATQPTAASIAANIAAGSANKVLAASTGTIIATFNASSEYVWVAHPAASATKTVWYNTALNNGSIGAGQFILAPATQNVNSPNGYWSALSFKIYISSGATDTSGAIEFRNA